jgi:hypothetical protein
MYTEVTFGNFLNRVLDKARAQHGIEFSHYPNYAVQKQTGDWCYQIENGFNVRVFRWGAGEDGSQRVAGPNWHDTTSEVLTPEVFEPRFETDFLQAIEKLK